jgi:hypothetical protein
MATIYNHEVRFNEELEDEEFLTYHGCRALVCTSPNDVIQLSPALKNEYPFILEHYQRADLNCTEKIKWDIAPELINDYAQLELSTYAFNTKFNAIRPDAPRLAATDRYNNKNNFLRFCNSLDLPIPRTDFYEEKDAATIGIAFPVFVKKAVSASGVGIFRCETDEEVICAINLIDGPYQIQQEIVAKAFLNVQYEVTDGAATHKATTEQILEGFVHVGNRYPSRYNPRAITDDLAKKLAKDGLDGIFALDVAVTQDDTYVLLECNPRWNGSTYPTLVAERLRAKEWEYVTIRLEARSLGEVSLGGDVVYDPLRGSGAIIINWGVIKFGKLGVLVIGTQKERRGYVDQITASARAKR